MCDRDMNRALSAAVVGIILITALTGMSGTAAAQDEYPDQCINAEEIQIGNYSGELSPTDVDTFILQGKEGESVYVELTASSNKLSFTALNQRVVDALYNSGSMEDFAAEVNHPRPGGSDNPSHKHGGEYSLTGGFSAHEDNMNIPYESMQIGNGVDNILAFDPDNHIVDNYWSPSPFIGPIYMIESGTSQGKLFFETNDPLCLRLQTTSHQDAGSWELNIQEEEPTSDETQDSEEVQSEDTQQPETGDQAKPGSETTQVEPSISFEPSEPKTGEQVAFSGSGTTVSNGKITRYDWNFGNGETTSGESVVHTYSESGGYNVELTVTTDQGNSHSTTQPVSVEESESDESDGDSISVETPGFGFGSIIISLGSLSYILKRKTTNQY